MSVLDSFRLDGRAAVVTGGAGLFGRQIVEALAEAGARTFMASRHVEKLEAQAQQFRAAGLDVSALRFDQGDAHSTRALLDQLLAQVEGVDILVNNAVARPMRDWSDDASAWEASMRVNATGLFSITKLFGEHMAVRGRGSIINIGSIQGLVGPDFTLYEGLGWGLPPDYFFNKGGMNQFSRYVAGKLGAQGVRCNTVCPGGFFNHQDPIFVERYNRRTFLGRMAGESDLKGVIVFLASDSSSYVTGAEIVVDGGYTAK